MKKLTSFALLLSLLMSIALVSCGPSDKDGADFVTDHFNFIRSAEPGEI